MSKISVVIHTFNNEDIIRECLEAVKDFDEIVICDMYSNDKTLDIAREYGAKIVMHENIGWADPARNFAISHASNEWVLVVDSDEIISPTLREYLYDFSKNDKNYTGLKLPRLNHCWGRPMELLFPDYILRFFKKNVTYYPPFVHTQAEVQDGEVKFAPKSKKYAILHYDCNSLTSLINKFNKYTDLEVEKLIQKKAKMNLPFSIFKCGFLIFEKYFFKGGYKDGVQGLIRSILFGIYKFFMYVKYWEYLREKNQD